MPTSCESCNSYYCTCNQIIVYKPTPNAKTCVRTVLQCPPVKKCVKRCTPPVCCPSTCTNKCTC